MMPDHGAAQLPFEWGHDPSHLESDFIEGDGNYLALAHVRAFPDWAGPLTLIEGPAKSGKSHLARVWAVRAGASFARAGELEALAREGGTVPLVVEDVDRIGYGEAPLFHLLNQAIRDDRPVMLTSRDGVANWPFATDDLKSRARLAARFTLALSDDIQLSQMFVKLFDDRQVSVDPRIVSYLVARMERSPEEAVALVGLCDSLALARGSAITLSVAASALALRSTAGHGSGQLELDLEGESDE
jgi:chromosomal replication initiation ATPase DnaA